MFGNIGWGEMVVLLVAALVILGPERLPGAVSWTTRALRQARDYASGASAQLKSELGPEFDDLRKPLADLNQLRGMTPRAVITKHLLDGDDSLFTGNFDKPQSAGGPAAVTPPPITPPPITPSSITTPDMLKKATGAPPPIDSDAT